MMVEPNYAGSIIVNLASLPDFLRKPILKKRMLEFFDMPDDQKDEVINNALQAGPEIPFESFGRLLRTWLEVLTEMSERQRAELFSRYLCELADAPQKLIRFNLDAIFGIFLSLDQSSRSVLGNTIRDIIESMDQRPKRVLMLITPEVAKRQIGL